MPALAAPALRVRAFEFRSSEPVGDGRTLEGYAAVFNQVQRIEGLFESWDEQLARGAFTRTLAERTPVMQFDHGKDVRTGSVPIASIQELREDRNGLFVRARLFANPVVEPVREAIAEGAISGMSIRFHVTHEDVKQRPDDVDLRTIREVDLHELGPVVFPAYDQTSVSVRSLLAGLDAEEHRALLAELARELAVQPAVITTNSANATVTTGGIAIPDLTGRPSARSAGGGDQRPSAAPSSSARARDRALRILGALNA